MIIPKKEGVKDLEDFYPIRLMRSLYKLLAKILAKKVSIVVRKMVSNSSQTLVKGR